MTHRFPPDSLPKHTRGPSTLSGEGGRTAGRAGSRTRQTTGQSTDGLVNWLVAGKSYQPLSALDGTSRVNH